MIRALIFDVDCALAETEETHRQAFNSVFAREKLGWVWNADRYRELLRVTGGKERLALYLAEEGLALPLERIAALHRIKNDAYMEIVRGGGAQLRPGVPEIVADARAAGLKLAICTTTSRVNIETLLDVALGSDGREIFSAIVTGEDVSAKKPAPDAYFLGARAFAASGFAVFSPRGFAQQRRGGHRRRRSRGRLHEFLHLAGNISRSARGPRRLARL